MSEAQTGDRTIEEDASTAGDEGASGAGAEGAAVPGGHTAPPAGVEATAVAGGEVDDVRRLEELLAQRAREARGLRGELSRREGLLRELTGRLHTLVAAEPAAARAVPSRAVGGGEDDLTRRAEAAVQRALDAEAGRAEALFALDEARAALASAPAPVALAEAEGMARGLRALVSELGESRDIAEARLMLAEHDRDAAAEQVGALRRELQHAREQLELELARAHAEHRAAAQQLELALEQSRSQTGGESAPSTLPDAVLGELQGRCVGLSLRLSEAEQALEAKGSPTDTGPAPGSGGDGELSARAADLAQALGAERARATDLEASLARLEASLSGRASDAEALRAERQQLREHLEDFEAAEAARRQALQAAAASAEGAYARASDELLSARQTLGESRDALVALGAGVQALVGEAKRSAVAAGLATVPGTLDAPEGAEGEGAGPGESSDVSVSIHGLREQVRIAEERLSLVSAQRRADADNHVASLASHRAQLALSRAEASGLREDLARHDSRLESLRTALRAARNERGGPAAVAERVAEALRILGA